MRNRFGYQAMPAPYVLPAAFAMYLAVGTIAAALDGRLPATGVLIACAAIALVTSFAAEPVAVVFLAGIGWLTVTGFSRPPRTRPPCWPRVRWPAPGWAWYSAGRCDDAHWYT